LPEIKNFHGENQKRLAERKRKRNVLDFNAQEQRKLAIKTVIKFLVKRIILLDHLLQHKKLHYQREYT